MNIYTSPKTEMRALRTSSRILPFVAGMADGQNTTGVEVTSYGQGQVTGAMYTVPAHGEITVDFDLKLMCVTPDDIQNMSNLIRSLLDASHQSLYDDLQQTQVSGGGSFFGFFGWGGASASYSDTKHTMDSFGLSEKNQETIVEAMMKAVSQLTEFKYSGTIYNKDYDYDVTGNLFGIVMDATISQDQYQNQVRYLAPTVYLQGHDGTILPTVNPLYNLKN